MLASRRPAAVIFTAQHAVEDRALGRFVRLPSVYVCILLYMEGGQEEDKARTLRPACNAATEGE
jgi:hypothetical protein